MRQWRMVVPVAANTMVELVITTNAENFERHELSVCMKRLGEFVEIMMRNLESSLSDDPAKSNHLDTPV